MSDLIKILKIVVIISAIILVVLNMSEWIADAKMNHNFRVKCKQWGMDGISNTVRGGRVDTIRIKIDTLRKGTKL